MANNMETFDKKILKLPFQTQKNKKFIIEEPPAPSTTEIYELGLMVLLGLIALTNRGWHQEVLTIF
jgi:hypothetical protein